jgi:multicomponent Na+:H+ antiporter subunit D
MNLIPIQLIFVPIIFAMIIYVLANKFVNYLIFVSQAIITVLMIMYYKFMQTNDVHEILLGGWSKNIGIVLKNDSLSIPFLILSIFIWWTVLIYSWNKKREDHKFWFFLLFLEGAFLGLVQTNDLFNFFIFLEIITIISSILITYKKDGYSVRSGLYYLLFNSSGMLFFLISLILIYMTTGTLNMDIMGDRIALINNTYVIKFSYILIIASLGVKSAFFPVYNWLPKAHGAAPSSISALLSGLLVKSGLYAFIRINQIFNITNSNDLFFMLGFFTALSGVVYALSQKDIKQILAFHTISQIGIILMGLSAMDGPQFYGGLLHIFNHAIFKSLLFLGAGIIVNNYNTRKVTEIRGVFKSLPLTSIFMIIGMLSITGAPLFNGFISKSLIKYSLKGSAIKTFMFYIVNLGTVISFLKFSQIFFGTSNIKRDKISLEHFSLFLLAIMCIVLGNFYIPIAKNLGGIELMHIEIFNLNVWVKYLLYLVVG